MIYLHIYKIDKDIKVKSKQLLKSNLSHYLETKETTIVYNENGKPLVEDIQFSISHCKNTLVQAFCFTGELGVDVELINPQRNYLKLAKRYFHPQESKLLNSIDKDESSDLFYKLWTAKEAVCKAEGGRLWFYLKDNYLKDTSNFVKNKNGFNLIQVDEISGYCLTLATESQNNKVRLIHV